MASYRFVDTWHVPAPAGRVYALLSRPSEYPGWWQDAFLEGDGDPGPAAPGKRARLLTRGRLPYRLRWELTCVEAVEPTRLVSRITGDFVGTGTWTIEPVADATRATLVWEVAVHKPVVRLLTPVLRPLFAWNHRWAMARGLERITALVAMPSAPELVEAGAQALPPVR